MEQLTPILPIENDTKGAPAFIAETVKENSGDIELVTIGPLTNIAQALDLDSELTTHINKITMTWSINCARKCYTICRV